MTLLDRNLPQHKATSADVVGPRVISLDTVGAVSSARRWDCRRSCAELELVSSSGTTSSRGTSAVHDDDVHVHKARHQIAEATRMRH